LEKEFQKYGVVSAGGVGGFSSAVDAEFRDIPVFFVEIAKEPRDIHIDIWLHNLGKVS
jgi:hypothetical protein